MMKTRVVGSQSLATAGETSSYECERANDFTKSVCRLESTDSLRCL